MRRLRYTHVRSTLLPPLARAKGVEFYTPVGHHADDEDFLLT